jgi:hypothetical protein
VIARLRPKLPTICTVHLFLAPALIFIAACLDRQYQTDFWHHLARGQQIVRLGRILDVDVFTFTVAGAPLRDANWLTQVIYWRLFAWGGLNCVQVVNAGLLAITLLVLVRICQRVQASSRAAGITGAMVFLGLCPFALIRPQTGSFLLFVLLLAVLMDRKRRPGTIWLAVPIMALWANVHGGFAIGLVLIGAFALEAGILFSLSLSGHCTTTSKFQRSISRTRERRRAVMAIDEHFDGSAHRRLRVRLTSRDLMRLLLLLALSVLATCANPYGWTIYQYAATLTARAAGRGIEEWLPPTLSSAAGWVLLLWIVALAAAAWVGRRKPGLLQVCLLVCFVPLACRSVRMVPWVLLATAPMMAQMLGAAAGGYSGKRHAAAQPPDPAAARRRGADLCAPPKPSISSAILLMFLIGASILSLPWLANVNPLFGTVRSTHRVEDALQNTQIAMAKRGAGRVFTRLEWGDYLSFAAHGENPVFCDGRIELYPDSLWKQYIQISAGRPDAERILDRWAVDYLVLDAQYHATLLTRIGRNGSWKTVWRSGQVVLLERSTPRLAGREIPSKTIADSR